MATLEGLARAADPSAVRTLHGHTDKITCLASPDLPTKNYLLSGSADCTVRVWNLEYARAVEAGTTLCVLPKSFAARGTTGLHGAQHVGATVHVSEPHGRGHRLLRAASVRAVAAARLRVLGGQRQLYCGAVPRGDETVRATGVSASAAV